MNIVLKLYGEDNGKGFKFILLVVLFLRYLKIMMLKMYGKNDWMDSGIEVIKNAWEF
jgi:hypothetical protein